jgi:hypothetical protein
MTVKHTALTFNDKTEETETKAFNYNRLEADVENASRRTTPCTRHVFGQRGPDD